MNETTKTQPYNASVCWFKLKGSKQQGKADRWCRESAWYYSVTRPRSLVYVTMYLCDKHKKVMENYGYLVTKVVAP